MRRANAPRFPIRWAGPGVAGLWTFGTKQAWAAVGGTGTGDRRITVCWLDDEPKTVTPVIDELEARRRARFDAASHVIFSGPFETVTPWQWDWFDQRA